MITQTPILITGIPRSGATMIAATINLCGAFGGQMSKRGMYCNDRIREELVKPYLQLMGGDADAQKEYPQMISDCPNWKESVNQIMSEEGFHGGTWMYKDSRIAQMWPVWAQAYPDAKWIIIRRRTGDIIESCLKTKYMHAHPDREGWLSMVHSYEQRFAEIIRQGINYKEIWPERMINNDFKQLYEILDWVGLGWNPKSLNFVESLLWGSKLKRKEK